MYISEFGEEGRHVAEARACLEKLGKAVPASGRKTAPPTEIERLLRVCEAHFAANRLTTGVGGTALECYQKVQSLDPANMVAVEGLQRVFGKYAAWARAALEKGDAGKARGHVEKLKGLAPEAPEVAELESGVARLEKQAAEAREKAEAERKERVRAERERKEREEKDRAEAEQKERKRPVRGFRDCDVCPEMVVVPAGSFMMGSPSHEEGRAVPEGPVHGVTIPAPLAVGKHEVTFDEWDACVAAGGCNGYSPADEGWGRGRRPVINVIGESAKAYVHWLSRKTGKPYRLLSEAEWEYAARAGTQASRYWGDEVSAQCDHANGYDQTAESEFLRPWAAVPCRDGSIHTSYVGEYGENGFGLADMLGNVWEWTEDCWHRNYGGAPSDGSAWVTRGGCRKRVLRGGSWNDEPRLLRSALRNWDTRGNRTSRHGFRVTRTLGNPGEE